MAGEPEQAIVNIGKRLLRQSRPPKDFIEKSLIEAANALSDLEQRSSYGPAIRPLTDSLVKHRLLHHKDKGIKLRVAICFSEIIRILAPEPSFSDNLFREIFELFISVFVELADTRLPNFLHRVKILETVAAVQCCQCMLDIGCDDLILKMFQIFFSVSSMFPENETRRSVFNAMLSIMVLLLKEGEVSMPLLEVILQNLKRPEDPDSLSYGLAVELVQNCEESVKPAICGFLTSCILRRDHARSELNEAYHEIILGIFQRAPYMLLAIIPTITQELLTDQVDIRLRSVILIGELLALPKEQWGQENDLLLVELLKRFSDRVAEVRVRAISATKTCYTTSLSESRMIDIHSALESRLLDVDASVRMEALVAVCDLAKKYLRSFPPHLIAEATKRLRDKMISVKQKAMDKLLEVYREYCLKCSEGKMTLNKTFEEIPCRVIMLCYDKSSKKFRPQNLELVLAEDVFPERLSAEDRMEHWLFFSSNFTSAPLQALNSILCQKRRFQKEVQVYLSLSTKWKENDTEDVNGRMKIAVTRIAASFPNPSEAEEILYKLNRLNDYSIFDALSQILDEVEASVAKEIRDNFLKELGEKNPFSEFLQLLSMKCMHNIFGREHIKFILDHVSCLMGRHVDGSSVDLLLVIIRNFPSLMKGCEAKFEMLLKRDSPFIQKLLAVLTKAGPFISFNLSDIYPTLEWLCLKGTFAESKAAIASITALYDPSDNIYASLCQKLVHSLRSSGNILSVLQSLGFIAKHSFPAFQEYEKEISSFIKEKIFPETFEDDPGTSPEVTGYAISFDCRTKMYGLKTLVRGFLSDDVGTEIYNLLDILSQLLQKGRFCDNSAICENDMAHLRLSAAKSVLRLSAKWDKHISPQLFQSTVMTVKDASSFVRKSFIDKTHKLLMEHAIPNRYACVFLLANSDCTKDLQQSSSKYTVDFIKDNNKGAQVRQVSTLQGRCITNHPAYVVVFLLHLLAHDEGFSPEKCPNVITFSQFCRPLVNFLHALGNTEVVNGDLSAVAYVFANLRSIFRAIKRSEDALDPHLTPKLHLLADVGSSIINGMKKADIISANSPSVVLLPSAFYRTCPTQTGEKANQSSGGIGFDENFRKSVLCFLETGVNLPYTDVTEPGRECHKDSIPVERESLDLRPSMKLDLLKKEVDNRTEEMNAATLLEFATKERNKYPVSSSSSKELQLPSDRSLVEDPEMNETQYSTPTMSEDPHVYDHKASEQSVIGSVTARQKSDPISASQNFKGKRKVDNELNDTRKFCGASHIRSCRLKGSAAYALECNPEEHSSLDYMDKGDNRFCDATIEPRMSRSKKNVLLDRTNSLAVNSSKEHLLQKKNDPEHNVSEETSASDVFNPNLDAIAFRTRRRKV